MRDDQYYQRLNQIREKYGYAHSNPAPQRPPTPRVESSLSYTHTHHPHLPYNDHALKPKVEPYRMEEKSTKMYEQADYSRQNYSQLQSAPRSPYGREQQTERIFSQAEGKVDHNKQIDRMLAVKKSKNKVIPLKANPPSDLMQE
jgi:hypothetical protein